MNNISFMVYGNLPIDYSLLGTYPENLDKLSNEELLTYFCDCFQLTFTNTVFSYYGNTDEIKELLRDSLLTTELDYDKRTPKEKWAILYIIVLDMFYTMHNTYLAPDTIRDIVENFDILNDEERIKIIHDLNFALFFAIEECMVISPSRIRELKASDEDTYILPELIDGKDFICEIFRKNVKKRNINKAHFEEFFTTRFTDNYIEDYYNLFISMWIDMMKDDTIELTKKKLNPQTWNELCTNIFAIISTFGALTIDNEKIVFKLAEELYYYIAQIYIEKLDLKLGPCKIEFKDEN